MIWINCGRQFVNNRRENRFNATNRIDARKSYPHFVINIVPPLNVRKSALICNNKISFFWRRAEPISCAVVLRADAEMREQHGGEECVREN